jgi:hypothetical protein
MGRVYPGKKSLSQCVNLRQRNDAKGHLRPGPTSSRRANVCYASDRYRKRAAESDEKGQKRKWAK